MEEESDDGLGIGTIIAIAGGAFAALLFVGFCLLVVFVLVILAA